MRKISIAVDAIPHKTSPEFCILVMKYKLNKKTKKIETAFNLDYLFNNTNDDKERLWFIKEICDHIFRNNEPLCTRHAIKPIQPVLSKCKKLFKKYNSK